MMRLRSFVLLLLLCCCVSQLAWAGVELEAAYPYKLDQKSLHKVEGGSTMPLYINITSFDDPAVQDAAIKVTLPAGFTALPDDRWQTSEEGGRQIVTAEWRLPADYGQTFDLLYIKPDGSAAKGEHKLLVEAAGAGWRRTAEAKFAYEPQASAEAAAGAKAKPLDKSKFNWYIQSVTLPVDNLGNKDDRAADGVIYVRDTTLEGFRNRMTGDGATNWSAVFNHPATFVMLEMRNPQMDVRVLKFKAELVDKKTGANVPGLMSASKVTDDAEHGWAGDTGRVGETTALISLDGKKNQTFILPLYVDYFTVLEGEYNLRITVSGNGQQKIQEVPLTIAKKHSVGLAAVGFSFACLFLVLACGGRLRRCIGVIGAKGAITVALFAALAFGGITLPTTLLGDLLHVFLGPFSGLLTGVLSGVLQYLLIVSLLLLFRAPGVLALMFFVKYMLSGLMFGHFTPLGLLSTCVYVAVLEGALQLCGFYRAERIGKRYMLFVALILGLADALVTFVNLEQMMFFYRLYYADWYMALYMLINGVLYSSVGAWLGYRTGSKLQQVMGE
ncbi:hypothetical protein [uncultured Phascolarctobacterium sp.]|uniref:hypothetical protein n=1 Tax=uncultured Phascolarctobacterium sp. TaxID=512296 RepID=UPI0025F51B60|nr:hypothetical protein [uncultured Phascolarctobacterium sp.]